MIRKLLTPTLLILALLSVAACGADSPSSSSDTTAAPAAPSSAPLSETQTRPAATTAGNGEAEPTEPAAEPAAMSDTRDIKDISSSLDGLRSYRLHFTFSFEGRRNSVTQ